MAKKQETTSWADFLRGLSRAVIVAVVFGVIAYTFVYGFAKLPQADDCYLRTDVATTTSGTTVVKFHDVPCE